MAITITPENKNSLTITNESKKPTDTTWDEATFTWDDADNATWDLPKLHITKESKNSISITNESKT